MNDNKKKLFSDTEVISSYSRQDAIDDGVLIDVTKIAEVEGYIYPVAVTSALWVDINDVPESKDWQDTAARLLRVLREGLHAIYRSKKDGTVLVYSLAMHLGRRKDYTVKMVVGWGDYAETVITFMLILTTRFGPTSMLYFGPTC